MIHSRAATVGLFTLLSACAGAPEPTEHLAQSMAAVSSAKTAGAEQVPQAALHLQLAEDQIEQARKLIKDDENERADAMTIRAFNDAELSQALTREAQTQRQLMSFAEAHPELTQSPVGNAPVDASNPPGPGATDNMPTKPSSIERTQP